MKKYFIYIYLLLNTFVLTAQTVIYPQLIKNASTIDGFIPKGWSILAITYGDLNKDRLEDAVVVIQNTESSFIKETKLQDDFNLEYDANPRIIMVLFKTPKGGFNLVDYNNTFILRNTNPKRIDPFQAVTINSNGILSIDFQFYYWSEKEDKVNATYKFRYQNETFEMIGAEIKSSSKKTNELIDYSFNFMTKKLYVKKESGINGSNFNEEWKSFKLDKLKTLQSLTYPFANEIENIRF